MRLITIRNYFIFLLSVGIFTLTSSTYAQGEEPASEEEATLTQGQAALIIARRLGLFANEVGAPTQARAIQLLSSRNVSPFGGWDTEGQLSSGDLARMLVYALGLEAELSDAELNAEDNTPFVDLIMEKYGVDVNEIVSANAANERAPLRRNMVVDASTSDPLIKLPEDQGLESNPLPVSQADLDETLNALVGSQGGSGGQVGGGSGNITPSAP